MACRRSGVRVPVAPPKPPGSPDRMTPDRPSPARSGLDRLVDQARADLARRSSIPLERISVVEAAAGRLAELRDGLSATGHGLPAGAHRRVPDHPRGRRPALRLPLRRASRPLPVRTEQGRPADGPRRLTREAADAPDKGRGRASRWETRPLVALRTIDQRLSTLTNVRPISPLGPVCDTAPRYQSAVRPVSRPVQPTVDRAGRPGRGRSRRRVDRQAAAGRVRHDPGPHRVVRARPDRLPAVDVDLPRPVGRVVDVDVLVGAASRAGRGERRRRDRRRRRPGPRSGSVASGGMASRKCAASARVNVWRLAPPAATSAGSKSWFGSCRTLACVMVALTRPWAPAVYEPV